MSLKTLFGMDSDPLAGYPSDRLTTRNGGEIRLSFFKHASLAITIDNRHTIYVDPVDQYADYASLPKADLVVVTHSHYDHLDLQAIEKIEDEHTTIICDKTSAAAFGENCIEMHPGKAVLPREYIHIEGVAAYNTSEGHTQFHPREREDCGYALTIGGTRIYIAGDGEPTEEMAGLRDIDIAFLPVNQPYTMTVDQAVEVVKQLRPKIFYPYHYGEVNEKTDIERLVRELKLVTDIRIRPME